MSTTRTTAELQKQLEDLEGLMLQQEQTANDAAETAAAALTAAATAEAAATAAAETAATAAATAAAATSGRWLYSYELMI